MVEYQNSNDYHWKEKGGSNEWQKEKFEDVSILLTI